MRLESRKSLPSLSFFLISILGRSWLQLTPCPKLVPLLDFHFGSLLATADTLSQACPPPWFPFWVALGYSWHLVPRLSFFLISILGRSWLQLTPCPELVFLLDFHFGSLLATADTLSRACLSSWFPFWVALGYSWHLVPSLSFFLISILGHSWLQLTPCPELVSLLDFHFGSLLATADTLSRACLSSWFPFWVALGYSWHLVPSLSFFLISILGRSWLQLTPCPELVFLLDFHFGSLLATADTLSQACPPPWFPFWVALGYSWHLVPSLSPSLISILGRSWLQLTPCPKLVPLLDFHFGSLLATADTLSQGCLSSWFPFWVALGYSWHLVPSLSPSLISILGRSWLQLTPCPKLVPLLDFHFGSLLATADTLSRACPPPWFPFWVALGYSWHLVPSLSFFLISILGRSWLQLTPCPELVFLLDFPFGLLLATADTLSQACLSSWFPFWAALGYSWHLFPSLSPSLISILGRSWLPMLPCLPAL